MISKAIVNVVLKSAKEEAKDNVIRLFLEYLNSGYDYKDVKASHVLECLLDDNAIIKPENVNLDYIKSELSLLMYGHEKYIIKNINIESVNNIDCDIIVSYEYKEKLNEERTDIDFTPSTTRIHWIDYPKVLNKC